MLKNRLPRNGTSDLEQILTSDDSKKIVLYPRLPSAPYAAKDNLDLLILSSSGCWDYKTCHYVQSVVQTVKLRAPCMLDKHSTQ